MLKLEAIDTFYGDSHILRGVSLALPAATSLGLLGRNGMGKTTLIRTLMGYVRAASGQVHWLGRDVTNHAPERMARGGIGYVPEGRGIFANLSVRENLVMAARAGNDGKRAWTLRVCWPHSRGSRSGCRTAGSSSRAASSRCWPSAAR